MPWEFCTGARSKSLHHCGCIISCLDLLFHYLRYLVSGSFTRFFVDYISSTWSHIKESPSLYFVTWLVNIGTKGGVWKIDCEIDLVLSCHFGGRPHFAVEKWESTLNWHWLGPLTMHPSHPIYFTKPHPFVSVTKGDKT